MTFARGRGACSRRRAARVLVSALLAAGGLCATPPAVAGGGLAEPSSQGAVATLKGPTASAGAVVTMPDGERERIRAGLFEMNVAGGGVLQTYSVDLHHRTVTDARYEETPAARSSLRGNRDAGRIRWILRNSYPRVDDLHALARVADSGALTEQQAAAGTQVALWRLAGRTRVEAVDASAERLADHLTEHAADVPEPKASLSLEQPDVAGRAGERLGPVTVRTGVPGGARLSPPAGTGSGGVRIVDADGKPVTSAADGAKVYFAVPEQAAPGSASLLTQVTTQIPVGRVLTSTGTPLSQTQIVAGSSQATVSATATARWADSGPVPAVNAEKDCATGTVHVTVRNAGDEPFGFRLADRGYEAPAGGSRTVRVPVGEDQPYEITVSGPDGPRQTFRGAVDCRTADPETAEASGPATLSAPRDGTPADGAPGSEGPGSGSAPGAAPGVQEELVQVGADGRKVLAETGADNGTGRYVGVGAALIALGAAALALARRRRPAAAASSPAASTARTAPEGPDSPAK